MSGAASGAPGSVSIWRCATLSSRTVERADQRAADHLQAQRLELLGLAQPDQQHARDRQALDRQDLERLLLAALEAARRHRAGHDPAGLLVERLRSGRELAVFEDANDERAGIRRLGLRESDLEH
jgi:hypothetical protein